MELEQLRQIEAIDRLGTITAAARALHISQPSISRSVQALEKELGQELFVRTRSKMEPTEAGRIAVRGAQTMLADERRMLDEIDELVRRQRTIVVGSIAPAPVWRLTAKTVERFPGTILSSVGLDESEVTKQLLNRSIDLAITQRPVGLPNMQSVPIMAEDLIAFVPKGHAVASQTMVSFSQLDGETFLVDSASGFWLDVIRRKMPASSFILQEQRSVLENLLKTTGLLGFVTNAAVYSEPIPDRVRVPISDAEAHVTFYLSVRIDASTRVLDVFEWISQVRLSTDDMD